MNLLTIRLLSIFALLGTSFAELGFGKTAMVFIMKGHPKDSGKTAMGFIIKGYHRECGRMEMASTTKEILDYLFHCKDF